MDTSKHTMATLFGQLGLPSDDKSIEGFIASHSLPPNLPLPLADFWTPAQAAMLSESVLQDADWCFVADQLAARLTKTPTH